VKHTRCLTWGETRNPRIVRLPGAVVHFCEIVTICGRPSLPTDPRIEHGLPGPTGRRPLGICRACFAGYRAAALEVA
jgi:hypothetical protein